MFDNFVHIFMNHDNSCCPLKNVTKSKQSTDKMWLTDVLKNACRKKNKLYTNYVKDPNLENEQNYKHYKNKLTSILRYSERLYYRNELDKAKLDNRQTWKILNKIRCKGKSKASNIPYTIIEGNKKYYEPKAIHNALNNYLSDVCSSISSKI